MPYILFSSFYFNKFIVSVAIISSSSVGIMHTFTRESSADIIVSLPRTLFLEASNFTPINSSPLHTSSRKPV